MGAQTDECVEECGGATTCINPDAIDLWVAQSGCTNNCNQVRSVLGRRERRGGIFLTRCVVKGSSRSPDDLIGKIH